MEVQLRTTSRMLKISIVVLLMTLTTYGESTSTPPVQTDKGLIRGEILTTVLKKVEYSAFKGIPYAKPPINDLRFKPPVEKEAWTGVLNAFSEASHCIQYNYSSSTVTGSEDCLYLNVYTPHIQFNEYISKPVMVCIHGGGFKSGSSNATNYGPDFLLEEEVIVVTFNYRLGVLGLLNLNHENATGNNALKDQNLALKWVKANIAKFGGNPHNITIFGQSSGAISIDLHILSDMSSGLFSQSIAMSGSTLCFHWGFQTAGEAEEAAFALGSKLGINTKSKDVLLQALLKASAADIVNETNNISSDFTNTPFRPTIESTEVSKQQEKFLTKCSLQKYSSGDYNKGPHLMGFTEYETIFLSKNAIEMIGIANSILKIMKSVNISIETPAISKVAKMSIAAYKNLTEKELHEMIQEQTNLSFVTGIDSKQQMLQIHNKYPIYYYRFSFDPKLSAHRIADLNISGASHSDDLPYVFYRPPAKLPLDQPDVKLTRTRMVRLWTNFVKYGNPTPDGSENDSTLGIIWPPSGSSGMHLEIGRNLTVGSRPTGAQVKYFQSAGIGTSPVLNDCK